MSLERGSAVRPAPVAVSSRIMRVATIDIGTNTVLLLVAERRAMARSSPSKSERRSRASARASTSHALLSPQRARATRRLPRRVRAQSSDARRRARRGRRDERDARRGRRRGRSAHVRRGASASTRASSAGDEEARLTFRGALERPAVADRDATCGLRHRRRQHEVVLGETRAAARIDRFASSFDVGSVRLTERHVRTDPPTPQSARRSREPRARPSLGAAAASGAGAHRHRRHDDDARRRLARACRLRRRARTRARRCAATTLERVVDELAAMPLDAASRVAGMEPKRADVIVAAASSRSRSSSTGTRAQVRISDRGVRWGLAEELRQPPDRRHRGYLSRQSCRQCSPASREVRVTRVRVPGRSDRRLTNGSLPHYSAPASLSWPQAETARASVRLARE